MIFQAEHLVQVAGLQCLACSVYVTPRFTTSDLLRSGSVYPVSKPVRFKLACCVDRAGVQARATCSHGDRYDTALTETLTLGYTLRIGG